MHGDLGTYIAHVIIRGVIYKFIFKLGPVPAVVIGLAACYYVIRRKMTPKRVKAKVKK